MRNSIFVVICLTISITISAQVKIVEITEAQAISLLDSLKRNNIGHTHTKQWKNDFINLEHCREEYSKAIVGIHMLIMPDKIDLNQKYNKIFFELGKISMEIEELEKKNMSTSDSSELIAKKQKLKYISEIEFNKYPFLYESHFERSIDQSYDNSDVELGDTIYVYSSGLPVINQNREFDESAQYSTVKGPSSIYRLNSTSVNFGIICNRKIEGQMYANRWK